MKNSISDLINRIETKFNVNRIKIHKYNLEFEVYPWIKAKLFHKLVTGKESLASRSLTSLFKQFKSILYGTWNLFLRKYDIWAFTNSVERIEINGTFTDKLFDPIASYHKGKVLIIEFQYFKTFSLHKIASQYAASKALFLISEEIYKRIFLGKKIKISNRKLITEIENELGCNIDVDAIVKKNIAQYKMMKFWLKILPHPKSIFLSVSYNHFGYIRAFKEVGIPVVEFQHGVISENHQAYNYKVSLSPNQFPDALAVFGSYEKEYLLKHSLLSIHDVFVIGRSITENYLNTTRDSMAVERICVSLQDGIIGDKAIQFLIDFNKISSSKYTFHLVARRTSESKYRSKFSFPDNFIFAKENIYETVAKCDIHVTAYSTVASEALSLGRRSILINIENKAKEVFASILGSNPYAHFIENHQELMGILNKHSTNYPSKDIAASNDKNIRGSYKENCILFLNNLHKIKA
tara:strand:+ start:10490 stop:11884 length:1395 start_codon:yes stop_codon:yes gene_type:complete